MPLHLLELGTTRPEDLSEFSVWIHKDAAREADPPKDLEGMAQSDDPPTDEEIEAEKKRQETIEEIRFFIRPMSGYEIENAANKTGLTKGKGRGDGKPIKTDGTSSLTHIAKSVVKIEPSPIGTDGQPKDKVTLDVIRGLPGWILMRITEHLDLTKKDQVEKEKN